MFKCGYLVLASVCSVGYLLWNYQDSPMAIVFSSYFFYLGSEFFQKILVTLWEFIFQIEFLIHFALLHFWILFYSFWCYLTVKKKLAANIFLFQCFHIYSSKFNIYSWFWISTSVKLVGESWTQFWQLNLRLHLNYTLSKWLAPCWDGRALYCAAYCAQIPVSSAGRA